MYAPIAATETDLNGIAVQPSIMLELTYFDFYKYRKTMSGIHEFNSVS